MRYNLRLDDFDVPGYRKDDVAAFFSKELDIVQQQTYDIKYPELLARMMFPTRALNQPGMQTSSYYQFDKVVAAKIGNINQATDIPQADVIGHLFHAPVVQYYDGYSYGIEELAVGSRIPGMSLDLRRADAAKYGIALQADNVAAVGAPAAGIATGLINSANIPVTNAAGTWPTATASAIIDDVLKMYADTVTACNDQVHPDTLIVPLNKVPYLLKQLPNTTQTVQEYLEKNLQLTPVVSWLKLNTAGASSSGRCILYKKDPKFVEIVDNVPFYQMAPEYKDFRQTISCYGSTFGVHLYYPKTMRYLDGV